METAQTKRKPNAPGKAHRKGLSLVQIMDMFPDDSTAEAWFAEARWPDGPFCPHCGSKNVQCGIKHRTMTHRCRECPDRRMFSLKTGTVMQGSKLGFRVWAIAIYLMTTSLKSVASMKLHRDLGITQKSAWHLAHRIRKSFESDGGKFAGPVEVDETYFGGKKRNMHKHKKPKAAGGASGKAAVVGVKDRPTGEIRAQAVPRTDSLNLQRFVRRNVAKGSKLYTDEARAYRSMKDFDHEPIKHSVGEYVRGKAHTNGIESFWSMLKRAHKGTFHKISPKHLSRYVSEFAGRHNARERDTLDQMVNVARRLDGKRLRYRDLTSV